MTQVITVIALILYVALLLGIGLYCRRAATNMNNFLLGGRSVGPWISAFSYGTSYFSAVIFIGYAGMHGWNIGVGSMWIGIGNAVIGCLIAWLLLAKPTRHMTQKLNASTMPEFFA
ncbi:MAG: sodium:solute symporter, partial [Oscillospiraceae bacterium]|nr:sodium:solute symporter [Oscillospiraceae bacterium]